MTEQRLADRRRRLTEQVFDYALEGIMVTGPDQTIEWVNPAFETTTGYSAREAVGQTPVLLHSGHHDSDFYRRMWSELKENGFWKGEIWNRRKDGEIYQSGSISAPSETMRAISSTTLHLCRHQQSSHH